MDNDIVRMLLKGDTSSGTAADTKIHSDGSRGENEAQRQRADNTFTFDPNGKGFARTRNSEESCQRHAAGTIAGWHSDHELARLPHPLISQTPRSRKAIRSLDAHNTAISLRCNRD